MLLYYLLRALVEAATPDRHLNRMDNLRVTGARHSAPGVIVHVQVQRNPGVSAFTPQGLRKVGRCASGILHLRKRRAVLMRIRGQMHGNGFARLHAAMAGSRGQAVYVTAAKHAGR